MDAPKGGLFLGTNGEFHDAEGRHVKKADADKRFKEHDDEQRKATGRTDRERLREEDRNLRINAAKQAAERTGLTGATEAIDRGLEEIDRSIAESRAKGSADSPDAERVDLQDTLSKPMMELSPEDRAKSQQAASEGGQIAEGGQAPSKSAKK